MNQKDTDRFSKERARALKNGEASTLNAPKLLQLLYFETGLKYLTQKKYQMAVQSFSQAINFKPSAAVYFNRGLAYSYLGQNEKAIADYTTAAKLEPDDVEAYFPSCSDLIINTKTATRSKFLN